MTQSSNHIAAQDTDDEEEDQGQAMGNVHKSIAVEKTRRNSRKPN